ncbi:hypothetical protein [Prosthecobacter dejongeii]|uniref:Uncharacterized protein n=1 Tax=Prosthecobacter dejongeii TaxID=48465 RepID=A0A7W8DR22_9BACT|nr:hypothetical protein [Prosthecobacter dejongeii]MBB5039078.1 hypothetical protein [Prosthecobacter dejongeii]
MVEISKGWQAGCLDTHFIFSETLPESEEQLSHLANTKKADGAIAIGSINKSSEEAKIRR